MYNMTVGEIKSFLAGIGSGVYYSRITIEQENTDIYIYDLNGQRLNDDHVLRIGINDYISAVHDTYFPFIKETISTTIADHLIEFLKCFFANDIYPNCFRCQ